ncbi:MAG: hypothetical protein ACOH2N_18760 [Devosia sp.]
MSDTPQVINTLRTKADLIAAHIAGLELELAHSRTSLAHINAAIVLFEAPDADSRHPALMDLNRLFKRRELTTICEQVLAANGPLNTRELALHVIRLKGFDKNDKHLKRAISFRIVQALRMQEKRRGPIQRVGKVSNVVVWETRRPT